MNLWLTLLWFLSVTCLSQTRRTFRCGGTCFCSMTHMQEATAFILLMNCNAAQNGVEPHQNKIVPETVNIGGIQFCLSREHENTGTFTECRIEVTTMAFTTMITIEEQTRAETSRETLEPARSRMSSKLWTQGALGIVGVLVICGIFSGMIYFLVSIFITLYNFCIFLFKLGLEIYILCPSNDPIKVFTVTQAAHIEMQ